MAVKKKKTNPKKKKRKGGVQTAAAKRKASARLKEHKKIRQTKPILCEVCRLDSPIDHLLIDGVRVWMCGVCFTSDDPEYLASEIERATRTGGSSLSTARG